MGRKKKDVQRGDPVVKRLEAIIASFLLSEDDKKDGDKKVKMLINLGFDNDEIAKIVGMAYGSVANIRMKQRGGKSGAQKRRK